MAAVFPKGVKSFPTHRNLIDDVRAEHVNQIQDEVVALQSVLGPLVTEVAEIRADVDTLRSEVDTLTQDMRNVEVQIVDLQAQIDDKQDQIDALNLDIADLESQILALTSETEHLRAGLEAALTLAQSNRVGILQLQSALKVQEGNARAEHRNIIDQIRAVERQLSSHKSQVIRQFSNVGDRLNYITDGKHIYATEVTRAQSLSVPQAQAGLGGLPNPKQQTMVSFSQPAATADPQGMFNGVGITIPVSGFWLVSANCRISTTGGPAKVKGAYYAEIRRPGDVADGKGEDRYYVSDTGDINLNDVSLNPTRLEWLSAGTSLTVYLSQSSSKAQTLVWARLSAVRLRGV